MVSGLTVYPFTTIQGTGRNTELKLISGSNNDVIKGFNSDLYWVMTSHNTATGTCYHTEIVNLLINGNITDFSQGYKGYGLAIWGSRLRIWNLDIKNCAQKGLMTDYHDNDWDASEPFYESSFYAIRVFNCGEEGWYCAGPHDAQVTDVTIIDGSRK